jgi:hypothetical protein
MQASGLNISEFFSDGNQPQKLTQRQTINTQWAGVPVKLQKKPIFRFPGGQRQMHQNAASLWGDKNFRMFSPLNYVGDFISLCILNNADVCFVVNINDELQYGDDIVTDTLEALQSIQKAGLTIRLIELGNEIYMNPTITGTGRFKSGLLYQTFARKGNIDAANRYLQLSIFYKQMILASGIQSEFAFCMAQDLNPAFRDWNDTIMNANVPCIGYALHLYPEKWAITKANIEKQLTQHFGRFEGKKVYFTELALQNGSTGMKFIEGYNWPQFWAVFEPILRAKFGHDVMTILWRMGSSKPNSYDFYKVL